MSARLEGRLIGLGVTGSIAAYKAVELLRALRAEGADVAVMLTPAATRFVGPLSFAALSRHPVETDVLDLLPDERLEGTLAATAVCAWQGARVFRTHDVTATLRVLRTVDAIRGLVPPVVNVRGLA